MYVNFICLCMRFVFVYILLCDECFDVTSDLTIKNSHLMHWICTSRKGKTRHSLCSPEILRPWITRIGGMRMGVVRILPV